MGTKAMLEKRRIARELGENTKISPGEKRHAMKSLRSHKHLRLTSQKFLNAHPDRGVTDEEVLVIHSLKKAGFVHRDVELIFHIKPQHGMGIWRAIHKRFPKVSKTLSKLGARRTKARKAAVAVAAVSTAAPLPAVSQAPETPTMEHVGVLQP